VYKDILLPVDLDQVASWERALPAAVGLATAFASRLHVMTVVPDFGSSYVAGFFPRDFEQAALGRAAEALRTFVDDNVPPDRDAQRIVAHGSIYEEIIATARRIPADLIVMASHRPELRDYLLGPNAARVVRHADTSVLVVRN
jgi:nucleotide-binding universal stress UspA family protein